MKKKMNKKGFTIVELVIVIAVIGILAAVLIPTFSGVIKKANESAALQEAKNAYTEYLAIDIADGVVDGNENGTPITKSGVAVTPNKDKTDYDKFEYTTTDYTVKYENGEWTVSQKAEENPSMAGESETSTTN